MMYKGPVWLGWLAGHPFHHFLEENVRHPISAMHTPTKVNALEMVGWPVLPPTRLLKVRKV